MEMLTLYYVLLFLWVPLLWPAMHLRGWKRGALLIVALAGALATANEIWQTWAESNAIRIDILLFIVVLITLYVAAVAVLILGHWRRAAFSLAIVLALTGGAIGYEWANVVQEGERVRATLDRRDDLLFKAKFRDRQTYEAYFGPFDGPAGRFPVGHWQAPPGSTFPRLIVNADGDAWLFYRCGTTECTYRPSHQKLERVRDGADREWRGLLRPSIGDFAEISLVQRDDDHLTAEIRGLALALTKGPPPIDPAPKPETLTFEGSFLATHCIRKHRVIRQVWLWREGARLFAVGVFQTPIAGERARFMTPTVLGEGRPKDGGWEFGWVQDGQSSAAVGQLADDALSLALTLHGRNEESVELRPGAIFADETIDLAPRTSAEDWRRWFDVVWTGHFLSGKVPDCT